MIFGTRNKHLDRMMADGMLVRLVFTSFHIWFVFTASYNERFFVLNPATNGVQPVSSVDLQHHYGQDAIPRPSLWERYGLFAAIAAVIVVSAIGAIGGAIVGPAR